VSSESVQPLLVLLGQPVGGNPTQYLIEKSLAHHDLDWRYLTAEVGPEQLEDAVRGVRALGFRGANLANPHRQAASAFLDRCDDVAGATGVVNWIGWEDAELLGRNTEGRALVEAIGRLTEPAGKQVVLLGAGRIARAAAVELARAGVARITVVSRTESHGRELADLITQRGETAADSVLWEGDYPLPDDAEIVVHATSIGHDDPDARVPLAMESLRPEMLVADVTIDPPRTQLLRDAAERGCPTLDGLEIFLAQTAINLALWTGIEPDVGVMREAAEEFLGL